MCKKIIVLLIIILCILNSLVYSKEIPTQVKSIKKINGISIPVITYHLISSNPQSRSDYCISPQLLEEDFKYLNDNNFYTLLIDDYENLKLQIKQGKLTYESLAVGNKTPVIITFDDGYSSDYEYVLPLMKKYNIKANFFIVGDYIGKKDVKGLSYMDEAQLKELYNSNLAQIGNHSNKLHLMSYKELQAYLNNPNNIKTIKEDYKTTDLKIARLLNNKINSFSYPYGLHNKSTEKILMEIGYKNAFTTKEGITQLGKDAYAICRYNRAFNIKSSEFFKKITNEYKNNITYKNSKWNIK